MIQAGGWRLAAGGWRLAAGGWRLAAGRDGKDASAKCQTPAVDSRFQNS